MGNCSKITQSCEIFGQLHLSRSEREETLELHRVPFLRSGQGKKLEHVPQKLVVNVVVVLHFRRFHKRSQQARATIC